MNRITGLHTWDLRFPTSLSGDGSDAMNKMPDYSAAYLVLNTADEEVFGCGFTFTIGRGNDICVAAIEAVGQLLIGLDVEQVCSRPGDVYRRLTSDSQFRWLGPEKGVVQLAIGALMNAVWDLASRRAGQPLWQFVTSMSPEDLVDATDLRYLGNVLTAGQALEIYRAAEPTRQTRIAQLSAAGYPCYTTSPGWLGYDDELMARLCREAVATGYRHVKLKVGGNLEDDRRRLRIAREAVGPDIALMIDANQVWEVDQAIDWVNELAEFNPLWIEEPTSPDDVLGHAQIRRAVAPIGVATGEHGMNRVLFKQLLQAEAIDFVQIDTCRLASINEILAVLLLAKKYQRPVCPHAGGVGLCELVSHVVMIDHIAVAQSMDGRVAEYVDHLHEHFVDPCLVDAGRYLLPSQPGYSSQIRAETLAEFAYPDGSYWSLQ